MAKENLVETIEIIESLSEEDVLFNCCKKILLAGIWLMRNEYSNMLMLPYLGPTGHWRCEFHPKGKPRKVFFRYSSGQIEKYLGNHCGGSISKNVSPQKLANAIMVSVPEEIIKMCDGKASRECLRWLDQLEEALAQKYVPVAFSESSTDHSRWQLSSLHNSRESSMPLPPGFVMPGDEEHWSKEPFWQQALRNWNSLLSMERIYLSPKHLNEVISESDITTKFYQVAQECDNVFDGYNLLKATFANIYLAQYHNNCQQSSVFPVSLAPNNDPLLRHACRILTMIHELHKAGYQRIRITPGLTPSGCHWRCYITIADNIKSNGWEPIDWETSDRLVMYSTGQQDKYFDWQDGVGKNARELAQMFIERFPIIARLGTGRDRNYIGWFTEMLGVAEHGHLPVFFADYEIKLAEVEMPPAP